MDDDDDYIIIMSSHAFKWHSAFQFDSGNVLMRPSERLFARGECVCL